jgi:leucyl-tRNA synthetase
MAVPAHDQRDYEFARTYNLDMKVVIQPEGAALEPETMEAAYEGEGVLVGSQQFNGVPSAEGKQQITAYLEQQGIGAPMISYRLKDWGISRQRYWGAPIPVVYCEMCGTVPVPDEDLPVVLPENITLEALGRSPLAECSEFVNTACPVCGGSARRETDTMDTFVESSWYFARYACPDFDRGPLLRETVDYWMPVDQYIGGIEHAVLHLLYARFFTKVLRDLGLIGVDEPFTNLLTQGMVSMETYRCPSCGWVYPEDVRDGACAACGSSVQIGRTEKMSKSTKNIVDPEQLISRYGADTSRLYCLFAAPPERDLEWSDKGVEGSYRFLQRLWRLVAENSGCLEEPRPEDFDNSGDSEIQALRRKTHQTIRKVTEDIEQRFHFNTAISAVMELVNHLYQFDPGDSTGRRAAFAEAVRSCVLLLAPMVPHICEELWRAAGSTGSVADMLWPAFDPAIARADEVEIVIQVNGKVRGKITVAADAPQEEIRQQALSCGQIQRWIEGKEIKKVIPVPGKLVSIVAK